MYCEKNIVECVTFIQGVIIYFYKRKCCISDTNLSLDNKVCFFLFKIPFLWREHICFKTLLVADCLISSRFLQMQQYSVLNLQSTSKVTKLTNTTQPALYEFFYYKILLSNLIINEAIENLINNSIQEVHFLKYQPVLQRE